MDQVPKDVGMPSRPRDAMGRSGCIGYRSVARAWSGCSQICREQRQNIVHRAVDRLSARRDDAVRSVAIQRIALFNERLDAGSRVAGAKKRTAAVTPQPLPQVADAGPQVDDKTLAVQQRPAVSAEHDTTARCEHCAGRLGELSDQLRLATAKTGLSFELEYG